MNREYRTTLVKAIVSWIGFTHRMMLDTKTFPEEISFGLPNYAVYRLGDGFGISKVDFASAKTEAAYDKDSLFNSVAGEIESTHVAFCIPEESISKLGMSLSQFALKFELGLKLEGEIVRELERGFRDTFEEAYVNALEGRTVPKPMSKN